MRRFPVHCLSLLSRLTKLSRKGSFPVPSIILVKWMSALFEKAVVESVKFKKDVLLDVVAIQQA